jgi:hypothetical protein
MTSLDMNVTSTNLQLHRSPGKRDDDHDLSPRGQTETGGSLLQEQHCQKKEEEIPKTVL